VFYFLWSEVSRGWLSGLLIIKSVENGTAHFTKFYLEPLEVGSKQHKNSKGKIEQKCNVVFFIIIKFAEAFSYGKRQVMGACQSLCYETGVYNQGSLTERES